MGEAKSGELLKSVLTYKDSRFVLTLDPTENLLIKSNWPASALNDTFAKWKTTPEVNTYATKNFKQARVWLKIADVKARKILNRAFVSYYALPARELPKFLDPKQVEGVSWVLTRSRSYLAHAPGAGKTCQAVVAAIFTEGGGQVVFIVPPSLTVNWAREVMKFYELTLSDRPNAWPTISVIPETTRKDQADWSAEFLIVPDSMLTKEWVLTKLASIKIRFLAVDEASRFKEPSAERTKALFGGRLKSGLDSPGFVYTPKHAVLLDGSPLMNRPMELWAPTYAMFPECIDFMSREDFGYRYCGAKLNDYGEWEFKGSAREPELKAKLQAEFMHVVREEELDHPERLRSMLFMTGDPRSKEHREWERTNISNLKISELDDGRTKVTYYGDKENQVQGELAKFRRELGIRKAPWVAKYVSDRLTNSDESILLFCWHREVAFELERLLRKFRPRVIIGGTKADDRERYINEFQSGAERLMIMNIAAGGRGHNLQKADRVVFAEFSWTDELNKQCEKRASRKGSTKEFVRCDYVVAPGSMDELMLSSVFAKADRARKVIG